MTVPDLNQLSAYDYELPPELLARQPPPQREDARLMLLDRTRQTIGHSQIRNLAEQFQAGDCLVLNNTKVIPAKLQGVRTSTGGKWSGLFLHSENLEVEGESEIQKPAWKIIGHNRGKLQPGELLTLRSFAEPRHAGEPSETYTLKLIKKSLDGSWLAEPETNESAFTVLERMGTVPLPPYLERETTTEQDWQRYQTTYAAHPGAVAAPTAGLHFTPTLLDELRQKGVQIAEVTLHVGIGTFRPVQTEDLNAHQMHEEWCCIEQPAVDTILQTKSAGGRVIAVGTTSVRTLEAVAATGPLRNWQGETRLFIRPGHQFRVIDGMLTNFHLPKSTLLVLVSAFAGYEFMHESYACAIAQKYRFYSYGDAMLIV